MTRPSRVQIHELVDKIRTADWRAIESRLVAAIEADRTGTIIPDGYRRNVSNGGRSGPAAVPVDPHDSSQGSVTLTPTEAAAEGRMLTSIERDKLRRHLEHAFSFLQEGAACAGALSSRLDLIDQLRDPDHVDRKFCESCLRANVTRWLRQGVDQFFTDAAGRLPHPMNLCSMCYDFLARKHGRLPSVEELRVHEETGRWRVKATA
jgi:hypothetical protein